MKAGMRNLFRVVSSRKSMLVGLIFGAGFRFLLEHFSDRALIYGNYGPTYASFNYIFDIVGVFLVVIFSASLVYKIISFHTLQNTNKRGALGGFFAALVGGCAACSLTLATYLGLGGLLAVMPYGGLEVKIVGIFILLRSSRKNMKELLICKRKARGQTLQ